MLSIPKLICRILWLILRLAPVSPVKSVYLFVYHSRRRQQELNQLTNRLFESQQTKAQMRRANKPHQMKLIIHRLRSEAAPRPVTVETASAHQSAGLLR